MKKFILLVLVVFSFVSVGQAIGEVGSENCTISEEETSKEQRATRYEENKEKIDNGEPSCGCFVVRSEGGATVFTDETGTEVKYCIALQEAIAGTKSVKGQNGIDLFSNYIKRIYLYGASIIGIICVLVIVVSGIQISLGGANSEFVNQGKERIMQAMLSMILLFGSALVLRTVNPGFFTADPPVLTQEKAEQLEAALDRERARAANSGGGSSSEATYSDTETPPVGDASDLSHAVALRQLGGNFSTSSSGNCAAKSNRSCTSLEGLQPSTIEGAKEVQAVLGRSLVISGGTEEGIHSKAHENGYKLDFGFNSNGRDIIQQVKDKSTGSCNKAHASACYVITGASGKTYKFYQEGNHWDVDFR